MSEFRKKYAYSFWIDGKGRLGTYAGRKNASSSLSVRNSDLFYNISFDDYFFFQIVSSVFSENRRRVSVNNINLATTWIDNKIQRIAIKYNVKNNIPSGIIRIYLSEDMKFDLTFTSDSSNKLIFERRG